MAAGRTTLEQKLQGPKRNGGIKMLNVNRAARIDDNAAFQRMFAPGRLTLGVFFPIEAFERDEPAMRDQGRLARRAEELGFAALWFRDVPLRDPSFGDVGQIFDPFVYLGWIAAQTRAIALATGAIVLPVRHPLHTAKEAASVDQLTGGRLLLGVASGDRPVEFPAFGVDFESRGALFREHFQVIRKALNNAFPRFQSSAGIMDGTADLIPKPIGKLPMMVTGNSRQSLEWIAEHSDGWIMYPRPMEQQEQNIQRWRAAVETVAPGAFKPFAQSFYLDLSDNPDEPPTPIHLGFRAGRNVLFRFLDALRAVGVHHVALNLKYGRRHAAEALEEIGKEVLPRLEGAAVGPHSARSAMTAQRWTSLKSRRDIVFAVSVCRLTVEIATRGQVAIDHRQSNCEQIVAKGAQSALAHKLQADTSREGETFVKLDLSAARSRKARDVSVFSVAGCDSPHASDRRLH